MSSKEAAILLKNRGLRNGEVLGNRFQKNIDPAIGAAYMRCFSKEAAEEEYQKILDEVNLQFYKTYDKDVETIMKQLFDRLKYLRIDDHGPKQGEINENSPFVETYFTRLPHNERTKNHSEDSLILANNGWVWECNPLDDFASPSQSVYLFRKVIVWGDCVKLRYGSSYDDNPFLWDHMAQYTRLHANIFHGFRIDNCHSTPLHVATYLLDEARKVRGDLYIVAELFTGSEEMDYEFLKRLGIGSLIREAMQAWSPGELSRLSHLYGGNPIGSFNHLSHHGIKQIRASGIHALFFDCSFNHLSHHGIKQIRASGIHALFFDCSHDNEMPAQKRTPEDTLPNSALVSMAIASTGSVYGYDEVIPRHLDIVHETRLYDVEKAGIADMKAIMNALHVKMGREGFTECHVHHENEYISVHRVHPQTREGYLLVAHTAFSKSLDRGDFNTIELRGTVVEVLESCRLVINGDLVERKDFITGLPSELEQLEHPKIEMKDSITQITIPKQFPPGSIALLHTQTIIYENLDSFLIADAEEAVQTLNLVDLNILLYRCDGEEKDYTEGKDGAYGVPNYGLLVYCGLEGWMGPLREIIRKNYLGHPLCDHLREGHWALDYTVRRLETYCKEFPSLQAPAQWLQRKFEKIKNVVYYLVPRLFAMVIQTLYNAAVERAISLFRPVISNGHPFAQQLALCSVQMVGIVKSTSLVPDKTLASMAAGLPHFSYDYMRCWGRDVFISLRGLLLVTGRFGEAKQHILAFASVLKHGMVPNLLDKGIRPRYNSRDSVWFFLQAIQDYVEMAPDGEKLLDQKVKRRFPLDDTFTAIDDPRTFSYESSILEVIHEIMQRQAGGLNFREANAGIGLDSQMSDEGFNINIEVDWNTGLLEIELWYLDGQDGF
ncbi:Glycogen debranching enzyme [Neolecta irregularis DAH-3]|uniref:Glycogen debranching enzyme n=1 Tax=Neolecta irregularis (strain DAH-3) TaxID=1198029 RepID=A0A1U7LJZ3_NEOID|nr:Glycogen debranching enzyme [Neolecta irregularis DAH-3]|eukprot:OLL22964.1 Glycogen debranching enzyme [Neolecta irregularis DAH-3]